MIKKVIPILITVVQNYTICFGVKLQNQTGNKPSGAVKEMINKNFDPFDAFKKEIFRMSA